MTVNNGSGRLDHHNALSAEQQYVGSRCSHDGVTVPAKCYMHLFGQSASWTSPEVLVLSDVFVPSFRSGPSTPAAHPAGGADFAHHLSRG